MSSPLAEIEHRVQQRAKDGALDLDDTAAHHALTAFVAEEIESWNDDHRRGIRSHALSDPDAIVARAMRNLTGYGPLGPLLADDDVWEVMINAPDPTFGSYGYRPAPRRPSAEHSFALIP